MLALMLVASLPSGALGATPVPWPSAKDITAAEPGVGTKAAGCMATFYRGRLSRDAWLTPWWKLTRAEKLATDAAYSRCLDRAERIAAIERPVTALVGAHPEVACAARGIDALSLRVRLAYARNRRSNVVICVLCFVNELIKLGGFEALPPVGRRPRRRHLVRAPSGGRGNIRPPVAGAEAAGTKR